MTKPVPEKITVLIVEDDPVTVEIIVSVLGKAGFRVIAAADGRSGLEMARKHRPTIILMDVQMPGTSGIDICRQLNNDPDVGRIPVVFVTSSTQDAVLEEAFKAGGRDFVCKPVRRVELLTRIGRLLELQKVEEKRTDYEKLKGVLETAGGVCHKLNQPLQYVLGAIQILMMDLSREDPNYTRLDAIREKIEQMGDITRKLAEITRYRTRRHAGGALILDIDQSAGADTD